MSLFLKSFGDLLEQGFNENHDMALLARSLSLPDLTIIAQQRAVVDPDMIYKARKQVMREIADMFAHRLENLYDRYDGQGEYRHDPAATGQRALKNVALGYLMANPTDEHVALVKQQYDTANNMTDRVAALLLLSETDTQARKDAFADFYDRFKDYQLVIDKWFSIQAMAVNDNSIDHIMALRNHPAFNILNPNRARSLYGAFAGSNPVCFHAADGRGYDFLVQAITTLNEKNPQIASRLLAPLREWRRYTPDRQEKMKASLQKIMALPNLSPDVFEVVSKTLK